MTTATAKSKIRVLLADDHQILRAGLRALLELEPDIDVVADVGNGRDAVAKTRQLSPDVVVMDIGMPGINGIEATRQILADLPQARLLCLSVHREKQLVQAMLEAGTNGYLLKTCAATELIQAVRTVAAGHTYLSPPIATDVINRHIRGEDASYDGAFSRLTSRERQVLQLIAEGYHTTDIAQRLHISSKTVYTHREKLMAKLDADSVATLIRYALREGISQL